MNKDQLKTRATEQAYDSIENMIATLQLEPGQAIIESDLVDLTGLGRTPVREALMRLLAAGLIEQQPRRGLRVSEIRVAEHLILIETRRVLEHLIAIGSARRATPRQREELLFYANQMVNAAQANNLHAYMKADQLFDHINHATCRNRFAVQAVSSLIIQCRRFWYAFQYEGDLEMGAKSHLHLAEGIATGSVDKAMEGANQLMDYLELFTRKVIE